MAETILSAESARSLERATATVARFSTNIADTVRATLMMIGLLQDQGHRSHTHCSGGSRYVSIVSVETHFWQT